MEITEEQYARIKDGLPVQRGNVSLTNLQNQRDDLNIEYGKLELEQATYAEPLRIDDEARQKLGMLEPSPQDIRLLRR